MSNISEQQGVRFYFSRPWELTKTSFLVVTWIILGLHLELFGPTSNILAEQIGGSYSGLSTILIARGAGYIAGNVAGALTQNIVKRYPEGLLSVAFLIASIAVFATPFIFNLYLLSTVFFFQGISQGITDLGGTSLMLSMWGNNVAAPLNVVHLGYGFGAVIANFLVKPFISDDNKNNSTTKIANGSSNIRVPYSITSFVCLLIAIGHLIFSFREYQLRREALKNVPVNYASVSTTVEKETEEVKMKNVSQYSPKACGKGCFTYGLSMSIVWIVYMFFLSGNDQTFGKFFFAYLKSPEFKITTTGATWGMIIYWLSYSLGRLICAVITVFVPVHIALSGLWVCGFVLAITWIIFVWVIGLTSTNLFVLGAFTGLVFSPTFPLSFGFINQRLNVNPLLVGLLLCGASFGAMAFQKLGGIVLDHNRKHFPSLLISCVIASIIFFVIATIISSFHQRKLNLKKTSSPGENLKPISDLSEEEQMQTYLANNEQDEQTI